MNTKTYLSQIERVDKKIQNKLNELTQLRGLILSISLEIKEVNVQEFGEKDRLGASVAKLLDLEAELNNAIIEYNEKKNLIISQISSLPDTNQYNVLYGLFVDGKSQKELSVDLCRTVRWIQNVQKSGLRTFEQLYGYTYLHETCESY